MACVCAVMACVCAVRACVCFSGVGNFFFFKRGFELDFECVCVRACALCLSLSCWRACASVCLSVRDVHETTVSAAEKMRHQQPVMMMTPVNGISTVH